MIAKLKTGLSGSCVSGQDKFFTQLKSSADGFSVVAEFFGRGLLNASTHTSTAA